MHWKFKALVQNVVARLPSSLSYQAYYYLQRRFGALRCVNPFSTVRSSLEIADAIRLYGGQLKGGVVLEVGTGRRVVLPMVLWLLGAKRIITVDLHPYLKSDLIAEDLAYFQSHRDEFVDLMLGSGYQEERLDQLMKLSVKTMDLEELLEMLNIQYLAPTEATHLPLASGSVDFQVSTNVFEHISKSTLVAILDESRRILVDNGLTVHRIDHSDHFSHSDPSLSAINFLRYSDKQWKRIAGNRYMYMNRLQLDDFQEIYQQGGQKVLNIQSEPDQEVLNILQSPDLPLDSRFSSKATETLATLSSMFVSRPQKRQELLDHGHAA